MPRIQRFAHTVQRIAYLKIFKPEQRDLRPDDVLVPENEAAATFEAWRATSFSGYIPYRNPPTR